MSIEITNGVYLSSNGTWQTFESIRIENGIIVGIDSDGEMLNAPSQRIDAQGNKVIPGLIDLNVNIQEPGNSQNGSISSELAAAAAGGVTTLCYRPETSPVNDTKAVTKLILKSAESSSRCTVLPLGAMTKNLEGQNLASYAGLKDAGCIGISNGFNALSNLLVMQRCFEYAKTFDLPILLNPIEPALHQGCMHEGEVSTTIGLQGVPESAELIAVSQAIMLAKSTGVRLHLTQLSCGNSVALIAQAKEEGLTITADVSLANLLFTDHNVAPFNSLFHCMPPLRSEYDRKALIEGLKTGAIDAITSGHQPLEAAEKQKPFAESARGMSCIELLIPVAKMLEEQDGLPLETFIACMTARAASVLGLTQPEVRVGAVADLAIFADQIDYPLDKDQCLTMGENIPMLGERFSARVELCVHRGSVSFDRSASI